MRKILAVAFAVPLFAACTVGEDPVDPGPGDEHPDPMDPNPNPTGEGLSGTIGSDMALSGAVRIKGATTIPAGVTVTVAAGSTLDFVNGANFIIAGTMRIEGTSAAKVIARAEAGSLGWNGFSVTGTLDIKYGDFDGGRIYAGAGANLVITDTKMYKAGGDYIIMDGGSINMTYSQVGAGPGETDSTHCNFHVNAGVQSITVTNSNISNAPYGLMFYGGTNANFQNNNWYGASTKDVDTASGVSGNFSGGWFEKGAPVAGPGAMITADNLAAAMLTDAGPRP